MSSGLTSQSSFGSLDTLPSPTSSSTSTTGIHVSQLTTAAVGISCHSWSADGTQLAISPNSSVIYIYSGCSNPDASAWKLEHVLTEHDLIVSNIDWCHETNKILSCAHDRNAFVWTYSDEERTWKPSLTLIRINRAALDCRWSPDGKKFCLASGDKSAPICFYDEAHDWWVSHTTKDSKWQKTHKSTVTCIAWHPSSKLIATGSTDFRCRVVSGFVQVEDQSIVIDDNPSVPIFSDDRMMQKNFGEALEEFITGGWVHSVAWAPSGFTLAYACHDATVGIISWTGQDQFNRSFIRLTGLPLTSLTFVSDLALVGGGHDMNPLIFTSSNPDSSQSWSFLRHADVKKETETKKTSSSNVAAARALFQSKTSRGQENKKEGDVLWTKHESAITSIACIPSSKSGNGKYTSFSSTAMDGRLIRWELPNLDIAMATLGL